MAITSWSHSKLVDFERCKYAAWLKHDQRIPEPERPLKPGQTEHANDRGTRVHLDCELYVSGQIDDLCVEAAKHFAGPLSLLRAMHADGLVSLEGEWGLNFNWAPIEWRSAWHRSKLDAIVYHSEHEATVIDFKTGRKFGNEVKHGEQIQLYQLNAFARHPELEIVHTELWYLDQDEVTAKTFSRDQGLRFKRNWHNRGVAITTATEFPANPNKFSCRWCAYNQHTGGPCTYGVKV